ncbi:DNA-binding response regulator [Zobellella denitrificans]|jgi:two-component system, OmpR family, response regulator QseB|uniref:XRE family transcriptional regulator n=1 Tax=Zobellella denitrificans TaxID=347534 RepID=A0A231MVS0_9GAMM|nr:response regulator [Zobellella denitrificans]ATG72496.1 XRE family transcriptional regulator [Zobellella denitrificans]OXS13716.1 DNA-binding response regulator [Zobellella denitrificans]
MRILLVEDDLMLGDGLVDALRAAGYTVDWLTRGLPALEALRAEEFAALILDLNLPDIDGQQLLQRLRRAGHGLPVLILTARDALDDRVRGLDGGADDYLVKPFALQELHARLRALVRRGQGQAHAVLRHGRLELHPDARQAYYQGEPVSLTPHEYKLLQELVLNAGRVFSKEQLEQRLYGWDEGAASNAVEVHIHHLRKKLYPELIRNIRGVGYIVERSRD